LVGCATNAWNKYPINVLPDNTCRMGGPEGAVRYYIWKCLDNKRVVISQSHSILFSSSANRYESTCDSLTEFEINLNKFNSPIRCEDAGDWQTLDPQRDTMRVDNSALHRYFKKR